MYETASKTEDILAGVQMLKSLMSLMYESVLEELPEMDDEERGWKLENFCRRQDLFKALTDSVFEKLVSLCELSETVRDEMYAIARLNRKDEVA